MRQFRPGDRVRYRDPAWGEGEGTVHGPVEGQPGWYRVVAPGHRLSDLWPQGETPIINLYQGWLELLPAC